MAQKVTQRYAFTVTLKPRLFNFKAEEQYDRTQESLSLMLTRLGYEVSMCAELTKGMNIHYHGTINFKCEPSVLPDKLFVDAFRKSNVFGFVCIKQITDEQKWMEYISKDLDKTRSYIHRDPRILNGFKYWQFFDTYQKCQIELITQNPNMEQD